jgi:hypothetical protein
MILLSTSCMSPFTASPAFSATPDGSAVQKFVLGLGKAVKGTSLDHLDLQIPLLGMSITGNLVRKLLSYGLNVQGHSCHHVNHRVSKSSSHAGGGEESNSSGACENTLGREILSFYGCPGSWGRRSRVCVSAFAALDVNKKVQAHETGMGAALILKFASRDSRIALLEDEV